MTDPAPADEQRQERPVEADVSSVANATNAVNANVDVDAIAIAIVIANANVKVKVNLSKRVRLSSLLVF